MAKLSTVEDYFAGLDSWQIPLVTELDRIVLEAAPTATKSLKWSRPTYEDHGLLCYIKATKKHIAFGFFRGTELNDPKGILVGTGDNMRHVKIKTLQDLDHLAIKDLIISAAKLNRT